MNVCRIKSYAKINLALNITGKLTLLHKIESIVSFIDLHDLIFIKNTNKKNHQISFYGKFSQNISSNNTVRKLFVILEEKKLLKDKKFQIKIKKNIPQKAGLGGGSMNAASILNFLIKKKFINISQKKIKYISNLIGSDVILGLNSTNIVLSSNNIIRNFSKCPKFHTLLIRPDFGCSTKKIYLGVKKFTKSKFNNPRKFMFNPVFLSKQMNALESIAFSKYPKLKKIKSFLVNMKNPLFVRMTGSGSVIVAYFKSKKECEMAKIEFQRNFENYWCNTSKTL
ncbi:4-(cytidine 5'-diphospho)-2-C-methyl-D-erythritol kinase [Candidatus Pelagibacter sp.]|nr:4-(cytidine 5'-diphospho)-2-C-methyl-D-erythritol kinase [Candidatus Pelagibacter sp.]